MLRTRPYFVAPGRKTAPAELETCAAWIGAEPWRLRPLPTDRPGLVLRRAGPVLHVPGSPAQGWHPGLTHARLSHGGADALVRALDLRSGERVLDATLGFGHDALVLAAAGARVDGLEVEPALLFLTLDGLWRHAPDLARNIHARCADHARYLAEAPNDSVDHVFLDPLFPAERRSENAAWGAVRTMGRAGGVDPAVLAQARRVACRRVVLKLAPGERPPPVDGVQLVASRRVRYAVWARDD